MKSLAEVWDQVLINKYAGVENAIAAFQSDDALLLVQNMGTVLEPIVGISLKLESSQASIDEILTQTKGFSIEKQEFNYDGQIGYFAILKCSKKSFNQNFILFAERLLEDISKKIKPSVALRNFTKTWAEFFSKLKVKRLTDEEIVGLFGELLVLKDLIDVHGASREIIESWQGPLANAWDFLLDNEDKKIQFEVKTSASSHDHVSINGLKQLLETDVVRSFLCLQKVNMTKVQNPSKENTLIDLIKLIRENLMDNELALSLFNDLLSELTDFDEEHEAHCRLIMFQVRNRQWYLIDKNFPALTSLTLSDELRQRVREVKYELELAGLKYLSVKFPF